MSSIRSGSRSPASVSFSVTDAVTLPFPHLSGAVDIVCVRQKDGSLMSSPYYVRFGKYQGLLKRREKEVYITVTLLLRVQGRSHRQQRRHRRVLLIGQRWAVLHGPRERDQENSKQWGHGGAVRVEERCCCQGRFGVGDWLVSVVVG